MPTVNADGIRNAMVQAADQLMRRTGFCPPPSVHLLAEDMAQPHIGFITCRPFRRGDDAAAAITRLGLLPSVLKATRLVVTWEDCDLRTALQIPGDVFPTAIVTLEASLTEHTLTWHPFDVLLGPPSTFGVPTVIPQWQPVMVSTASTLLPPVAGLLDLWRQAQRHDIEQTARDLEQGGYRISWVARS